MREVTPAENAEQLRRTNQTRFTTKGQPGASTIYLAVTRSWARDMARGDQHSGDRRLVRRLGPPGHDPSGEEWGGFSGPEPARAPDVAAASQMRRSPGMPSVRPPPAAVPPPAPASTFAAASHAPSPPTRPSGRDQQAEARLQRFLRHAVSLKASDLHLSTGSEPMVRVDGEMRVLQGAGGELRATSCST